MSVDSVFYDWLNLSMPEKDEFMVKVAVWLETIGKFNPPTNPDDVEDFSKNLIEENKELFDLDSAIYYFTKDELQKISDSIDTKEPKKEIKDTDFFVRLKMGSQKQLINLNKSYLEFEIDNGRFKISNKLLENNKGNFIWLSDMPDNFKLSFINVICDKIKLFN